MYFKMKELILQFLYKLRTYINQCRSFYEATKIKNAGKIIECDIEEAISCYSSIRQRQPINFSDMSKQEMDLMLSIIIPVYNAENTIIRCVSSVLEQRIKDPFEVIIINDGSTDNTLIKLEEFRDHTNIRVMNQNNGGAGRARNRGLAVARGKYIMFVDSDDMIPDGAINRMLRDARKTNADIVIGNINKIISGCRINIYRHKGNPLLSSKIDAYNLSQGTPWGKLYRRTVWNNITFPEKYAYEDTIIFLNVFKNADTFYFEKEPIYCFVSNRNSLYKREQQSARCLDILWVILECVERANTLENSPSIVDYQIVLWHLSRTLYTRVSKYDNGKMLLYAFEIASKIIKEKVHQYGFTNNFFGKNRMYYELIEKAFVEGDYGTWKQCSKVLSYSGAI